MTSTKLSPMAKAAIAMLEAGAYDCGGNDRWAFGGKYELGCVELVKVGFADTHPRGLMTFSYRHATLSTPGQSVQKTAYRLTHAGKTWAERMKREAA